MKTPRRQIFERAQLELSIGAPLRALQTLPGGGQRPGGKQMGTIDDTRINMIETHEILTENVSR